jgi:hypothetical protein
MRRSGALAVAVMSVFVLAGCTTRSVIVTTTTDSTVTQTTQHTSAAAPAYKPPPAKTVAPLPPDARPAASERERACPYIASMPTDNPDVNVGDIDGSRIYRTTVVTTHKPVGCRFYFWSGPFYAVADILPKTFATHDDAHNAMVLTAEAGKDAIGKPNIRPGVDAVLYRTRFYGADGDQDWACAFTKGNVMVVVHTERTDTSLNALELAKAVAPKISG